MVRYYIYKKDYVVVDEQCFERSRCLGSGTRSEIQSLLESLSDRELDRCLIVPVYEDPFEEWHRNDLGRPSPFE